MPLPYEIILVPALLILASHHMVEVWRWFRVIRCRPAFRRKATMLLLVVIVICNLIVLGDHVAKAAVHIAPNVATEVTPPARAPSRG